MIALDTNVLVRLITRDDPGQSGRVDALLSAERESFFLADIVLAELSWVLTRSYEYSRAEVAEVFDALLDRIDAVFENEECVRRAVKLYRDGLDLADGLLLGRAGAVGCERLATFDDRLLRMSPAFARRP